MPRLTVHGHRPACLSHSQTLDCVAPSTPSPVQVALQRPVNSSAAPDHSVQQVRLGLIKLKIHRSTAPEIALREFALRGLTEQKIRRKGQAPYLSKSGRPEVELNCKVQVKANKSADSESALVTCIHLANRFATRAGKARDLIRAFSNEDGIAAEFEENLTSVQSAYQAALREATPNHKCLFWGDELGRYLMAAASQLTDPRQANGVSDTNFFLVTASHTMALHLERKSSNGVGYFSAKLYDPNNTATYRRVVKTAPEDFTSLRLVDMLAQPMRISAYRGRAQGDLPLVAVCLDPRVRPVLQDRVTVVTPETMHLALALGLRAELESMLAKVFASNRTPGEVDQLLRAEVSMNGVTARGLTCAFTEGHCDTVRCFTQGVLGSNLRSQTKFDLLLATLCNEIPGLCIAASLGHTQVVTTFVQQILASNLTTRHKEELLAARMVSGESALFVALEQENGAPDTVSEFVRAVSGASIGPQIKFDLLRAEPSGDRTPGLFFALQEGRAAAVQAFAHQILKASQLDAQAKVELLAAKQGDDGTPGLFMAFQCWQVEAVRVFAHEVLASDLADEHKTYLLAARCSLGIRGVQMAANEPGQVTLNAFSEIITRSSLSDAHKDELLAPVHAAMEHV